MHQTPFYAKFDLYYLLVWMEPWSVYLKLYDVSESILPNHNVGVRQRHFNPD